MKSSKLVTMALCLILSCGLAACGSVNSAGTPSLADISAVIERKPIPTDAIVTDPKSSARYNAAVESWGDRLRMAGLRICNYYKTRGVKVDC